VRSTPEWLSHDLAETASRPGTSVPWSRAKKPTAWSGEILAPRQLQGLWRKLAGRRLVVERGQRLPRLDQAGGDQLRDGEDPHLPGFFAGVDIARGRIGGPQIDAHHVAARPAFERRTQGYLPNGVEMIDNPVSIPNRVPRWQSLALGRKTNHETPKERKAEKREEERKRGRAEEPFCATLYPQSLSDGGGDAGDYTTLAGGAVRSAAKTDAEA
jgi:hypothetical protein